MTAINAFYDRDDRFAYLATDGADFNYSDGSVRTLGNKISLFPEYKIAWAVAGPNIIGEINAYVCGQLIADQSDILKHMREAFLLYRSNVPEGDTSPLKDLTILAVVSLEDEARPAIYRIASNPAAIAGHPVNQWHELDGVFIPAILPDYIADRGAWIDDAVSDCRALFRAQRHHDFEGMHGAPAVGGTCSLYRVGPDGIKAWDVLEFADKVGDVADIADTGAEVWREIAI